MENYTPTAPSNLITLPYLPSTIKGDGFEYAVYICFIKHLGEDCGNHLESQILSAIESVGIALNISSALAAKTLSDLGLRAPRRSFPISFLDFADKACPHFTWEPEVPSCVIALRDYWKQNRDRYITSP